MRGTLSTLLWYRARRPVTVVCACGSPWRHALQWISCLAADVGAGIFHANLNFHYTGVSWDLVSTQKIPVSADVIARWPHHQLLMLWLVRRIRVWITNNIPDKIHRNFEICHTFVWYISDLWWSLSGTHLDSWPRILWPLSIHWIHKQAYISYMTCSARNFP